MIYVDYSYIDKQKNVKQYTKAFDTVNKAIRFIYLINSKPNYSYDGFSCDDEEELNEMVNKL